LKKEPAGRGIFAPQICCGGKQMSDPRAMAKPVQSPFVRCKDARVMLGGRSILERCERASWLTPVRRGKRLTLFNRDDIEAAQLRVSWGELP
jgi:hypothetical protein